MAINRLATVLAFVGVVLVGASRAAQQTPGADPAKHDRLSVPDARTLCLWLHAPLMEKTRPASLTVDALRTRTELRMRTAGLRPLYVPDNLRTCFGSDESTDRFLQVQVQFGESSPAFLVSVDFMRKAGWWVAAPTPRDDGIRSGPLSTLSYKTIGTHKGTAAEILEALDVTLDRFLNDFLTVNAK